VVPVNLAVVAGHHAGRDADEEFDADVLADALGAPEEVFGDDIVGNLLALLFRDDVPELFGRPLLDALGPADDARRDGRLYLEEGEEGLRRVESLDEPGQVAGARAEFPDADRDDFGPPLQVREDVLPGGERLVVEECHRAADGGAHERRVDEREAEVAVQLGGEDGAVGGGGGLKPLAPLRHAGVGLPGRPERRQLVHQCERRQLHHFDVAGSNIRAAEMCR
jgi:hypothetical protein